MSNNVLEKIINILTIIVTLAGIVMAIFFWEKGGQNIKSIFGIAVSIITFLFNLYINVLWMIPGLSNTPNVNGWYEVKIIPNANKKAKEVNGIMRIRQNFIKCKIIINFEESKSSDICSFIDNDNQELIYTYRSITCESKRKLNPTKTGTAILNIINKNNLKGSYFTTELSRGDMICIKKKKKEINI